MGGYELFIRDHETNLPERGGGHAREVLSRAMDAARHRVRCLVNLWNCKLHPKMLLVAQIMHSAKSSKLIANLSCGLCSCTSAPTADDLMSLV